MALTFTETTHIKKAVQLINSLDSSKFPLLLSRIAQKLHLKDEHAFSEDEEKKLVTVLGMTETELELIVHTCEFFLHQAAYHSAKPAVLQQQLINIHISEEKVEKIVEVWSGAARGVIEKLRKRTLAPKQLESVDWALQLQMANSRQSRLKESCAVLQLTVSDDTSQTKEKVNVEFSHESLYQFYNQLETIQSQLDALN